MSLTESFSPADDIGNPASMALTPSLSSWRAISSFFSCVKDTPGVCSPSRRVVSKMSIALFLSGISTE
jgi:hypothetical protein